MKTIVTYFFMILFTSSIAQNLDELLNDLPKGNYDIGFKLIETHDKSRTYQYNKDGIDWRPMQIACWYPSNNKSQKTLTYSDYIKLSVSSEFLIKNEALEKDKILEILNASHVNKKKLSNFINQQLSATMDATPSLGNYPLVLYAPGASSHWYENVLLAERLASFGYTVMISKSRGHKSPYMSMNWEGVEAQTRDLEFMQFIASELPFVDLSKVHVIGRSWGAIAAAVFSIRNQNTVSISSVDGTLSYNAMLLMENSPYPGGKYISKPIFLQIGKKRSKNATPIDRENYFNNVELASAYSIEYEHMPHVAFGSYALLYNYLSHSKIDNETAKQLISGYQNATKHLINFIESQNKKSAFAIASTDRYTFTFQAARKPVLPDYSDFSYALETNGILSAKKIIDEIHKKAPEYDFRDLVSSNYLNRHAYKLKAINKTNDAIETLIIGTKLFPEDANLYDSLGEIYYAKKDIENAVLNYKKSYQINPKNENAKIMIEKINNNK